MIRTKIAAIMAGFSLVSSAQAGFSFTSTDQGLIGGYRVFLIRAINDGVGTGTELDAYELNFTTFFGSRARFNVVDGQADLINATNPNRGFLRVGSYNSSSIVYTSPPISDGAAWNSIQSWSVAAISTGSDNATGNGAVIARLFMAGSLTGGLITGQIGGNLGSAVPVNFQLGPATGTNPGPPSVTISPNNLVIDVNSQTSFGPVMVSAADPDDDHETLTAGVIPAQIADNIQILGSGPGPLIIYGSGFDASDVGVHSIDFTAVDSMGDTGIGSFTLDVVIPEPATLILLAGLSFLGLHHRKSSGC